MTYSNAWNESQPQGTAAATTIDDIIRQLKVDIRERMNTIVSDWTTDPIVTRRSRTMCLGPEAVITETQTSVRDLESGYTVLNDLGLIVVPVNDSWEITRVEVIVNKNAASSLSLSVYEWAFSTAFGSSGIQGPIAFSGTGAQMVTIYSASPGSAGILISDSKAITIHIAPSSAVNWYFTGARITYWEG